MNSYICDNCGQWSDAEEELKALKASLTPKDWQPIASAPKDEDVFVFFGGEMGIARFYAYAKRDGGWWQWDHAFAGEEIQPTHWMPLPPALPP